MKLSPSDLLAYSSCLLTAGSIGAAVAGLQDFRKSPFAKLALAIFCGCCFLLLVITYPMYDYPLRWMIEFIKTGIIFAFALLLGTTMPPEKQQRWYIKFMCWFKFYHFKIPY
ncbi:hypothetical protein KKB18_01365 [bacterium]|nr:hypothetical protein [bacterium]